MAPPRCDSPQASAFEMRPERLFMSFQAASAGTGSGEVPGRALSLRLPVSVGERGSFMACALAGCRGEAWLKKGLLGSK
jgi:hypothetical protein